MALELFVEEGCPYSAAAMRALETLGVPYEKRDIAEPAHLNELLRRGGRRQVPYLSDVEAGVSLYDSKNIIAYLEQTYGDKAGQRGGSV